MDIAKPAKPSTAAALYTKDKPDEPVACFCTGCRTVKPSKADAEACASCAEWQCEVCGAKAFAPYQRFCSPCLAKRRGQQEQEKLEQAERIPLGEYPDDYGVVWEGDYHSSVEMLLDHCECEGIEPPKLVWATSPIQFALNADDTIEEAFENWAEGWDDAERGIIEGRDEFDKAVEAFNKANEKTLVYMQIDKAVEL